MAALTAITPTRAGASASPNTVAATDTISAALVGVNGCLLEIINGNASADAMTISDAGTSAAGTPAVSYAASVLAGTSQVFKIVPSQVNPSTGLVTITHGTTPTVTYKLFILG
jgi:hypothetical protein